MAVKKRTDNASADDAADKGKTTTSTGPNETGEGVVTGTDKDITTQAEGRSTSVTAPNEVKNDPGATGNKTIDESRVAAHQEALKERDGDNAKSPYSDIPAAGGAASNDEGDEAKTTSDGKPIPPKPSAKNAKADDGGDAEDGPDENAPNTPDNVLDGAALGTSFTHGSADFTSSGIPVVEDQYSIDKVPDGTEFYAAWLHNPAQSDDHYGIQNSLSDLQSGKLERRGIPASYWNGQHTLTPPRARRDAKSRKGYEIVG